jgi:hypothetical protein
VDYFKTHVRASAQALLVICRYLATQPEGRTVTELQGSLQPSVLVKSHDAREGTLGPSIRVGEHLDILKPIGSAKQPPWCLTEAVDPAVLADSPSSSRAFYGLLLRNLGIQSLAAVEVGAELSDIALGCVWLAMLDPLTPLSVNWNEGPEDAIVAADLRAAIRNQEQWRSFYRWAQVLGLLTESSTGKKSQVMPDSTRALRNVLPDLPRRSSADQWFRQLRLRLPVLGHPQLVERLPGQSSSRAEIGGSLALAVHKLERAGLLGLTLSPDATSTVVLQLGTRSRTVSHVEIMESAT